MTSLSERPLRSMGNGGGGAERAKRSRWRKTRDDERKRDSSCVAVLYVGNV